MESANGSQLAELCRLQSELLNSKDRLRAVREFNQKARQKLAILKEENKQKELRLAEAKDRLEAAKQERAALAIARSALKSSREAEVQQAVNSFDITEQRAALDELLKEDETFRASLPRRPWLSRLNEAREKYAEVDKNRVEALSEVERLSELHNASVNRLQRYKELDINTFILKCVKKSRTIANLQKKAASLMVIARRQRERAEDEEDEVINMIVDEKKELLTPPRDPITVVVKVPKTPERLAAPIPIPPKPLRTTKFARSPSPPVNVSCQLSQDENDLEQSLVMETNVSNDSNDVLIIDESQCHDIGSNDGGSEGNESSANQESSGDGQQQDDDDDDITVIEDPTRTGLQNPHAFVGGNAISAIGEIVIDDDDDQRLNITPVESNFAKKHSQVSSVEVQRTPQRAPTTTENRKSPVRFAVPAMPLKKKGKSNDPTLVQNSQPLITEPVVNSTFDFAACNNDRSSSFSFTSPDFFSQQGNTSSAEGKNSSILNALHDISHNSEHPETDFLSMFDSKKEAAKPADSNNGSPNCSFAFNFDNNDDEAEAGFNALFLNNEDKDNDNGNIFEFN